jgi:hypothetical protein
MVVEDKTGRAKKEVREEDPRAQRPRVEADGRAHPLTESNVP